MKLPPLNALRAFDATARHLSVRHAADELFVTPGAVSQQLKLLEQWLGQRLLERSSRGIALTVSGAAFHAATHRHLRAISAAAERLRPQHNEVGISVLPSFATRCLVPHLPAFTRQHPSVQVRVDANSAVVDFDRESFDLTVREAASIAAPLQCQPLFPVVLFPVCTPDYRRTTLRTLAGLRQARLLHEFGNYDEGTLWARWLASAGLGDIDSAGGMYFSHTMHAVDSALRGQGVALTAPQLVADDLAARRLVIAFRRGLDTGRRCWLVWPARPMRDPARLLADWLRASFGQAPAGPRRAQRSATDA